MFSLRSLQQKIWRSRLFPLLTCGVGIILLIIACISNPDLRAEFGAYVRLAVFLVVAFFVAMVATSASPISPLRGGGVRGIAILIPFFAGLIRPLVLAVGLWFVVRLCNWESACPYWVCDCIIGLELRFIYGLLLVDMIPLSALTAAVGVFFGADFSEKITAGSAAAWWNGLLVANATLVDGFLNGLKSQGMSTPPPLPLLVILLPFEIFLFFFIPPKAAENILG